MSEDNPDFWATITSRAVNLDEFYAHKVPLKYEVEIEMEFQLGPSGEIYNNGELIGQAHISETGRFHFKASIPQEDLGKKSEPKKLEGSKPQLPEKQ